MNVEWIRQDEQPAFEDLLWSRPENKSASGKLLIVGGNQGDVFGVVSAHQIAKTSGIGEIKVVVPDKLPKQLLTAEGIVPVESTKSGGLALEARDQIATLMETSDVVLWPGSLGKDSQTTRLLENVLLSFDQPTVLTGDSLDTVISLGKPLVVRHSSLFVLTLAQLRSLNTKLDGATAVTLDIPITRLVEMLSEITSKYPIGLTTLCQNQLVSAYQGRVSTTKLKDDEDKENMRWRVSLASISAVLWAQFPDQPFSALTSAAWLFKSLR